MLRFVLLTIPNAIVEHKHLISAVVDENEWEIFWFHLLKTNDMRPHNVCNMLGYGDIRMPVKLVLLC